MTSITITNLDSTQLTTLIEVIDLDNYKQHSRAAHYFHDSNGFWRKKEEIKQG